MAAFNLATDKLQLENPDLNLTYQRSTGLTSRKLQVAGKWKKCLFEYIFPGKKRITSYSIFEGTREIFEAS